MLSTLELIWWLGALFITVAIALRNEVVIQAYMKHINKYPGSPEIVWKRYWKNVFDLRKWTYKQFFPNE